MKKMYIGMIAAVVVMLVFSTLVCVDNEKITSINNDLKKDKSELTQSNKELENRIELYEDEIKNLQSQLAAMESESD